MAPVRQILSAKEIMVSSLITLSPDQNIFEAMRVLMTKRISGAPVVDGSGSLVVMLLLGEFSGGDEVEQLLLRGDHLQQAGAAVVFDGSEGEVVVGEGFLGDGEEVSGGGEGKGRHC